MPTEQHEIYVEDAVVKLRSEGWICETQYHYEKFFFDIFAYHPVTKQTKVVEVQMNGQHKKELEGLLFPVEYVFPEQAKTTGELGSIAKRLFAALASPDRINMTLAIEERPRYYIELNPFVGTSKGLIAYHLRKLVRGGIVKRVNGKYELTDLGKNMLSFLRSADNTSGSLIQAQEWKRNKSRKPKSVVLDPAKGFDRYTLRQALLENPPMTFTCKELAEETNIPVNVVGSMAYQMGLSHLVRDSTMSNTMLKV